MLDEIGELPLAAQVRLLRILQDGWLEKVGGQEPIHVDVRIVAATHRDLAAMVNAGQVPRGPVVPHRRVSHHSAAVARADGRHRRDCPPFRRTRRSPIRVARRSPRPEDIELLTAYAWPGNIRELAAVIDRAAILGDGKRLEVAKALGVTAKPCPAASNGEAHRPAKAALPHRIQTLDEAMKQHIELALTHAHGRIEGRRGAAVLLQINPHTLPRPRMRKLKIDWTQFRRREEEILL